MFNPNPIYNPMILDHNVNQPNFGREQLLITYSLFEKRNQIPGNENSQISDFYDGCAMFANVVFDTTEITVLRFKDVNFAQYVYNGHLFRENVIGNASLVAKLRFMCWTPAFIDVGFEKLPIYNIYKWHSEVYKAMYIFSDDGVEVVALAQDVQQVLKNILKGLQALHSSGCYHGNLINGLWFNIEQEVNVHVRFTNFANVGELPAGIKKDMDDFNVLLDWVMEANPAHLFSTTAQPKVWPPGGISRFRVHVNELNSQMDFETLRRGAYFVYNHPIFNTAAENHTLLSKIHAIKLRSRNTFDKYVTLKKFKNWHECMTHGCYFWKDFERNMETYKTKCTSLLDFHINVVKHHKANNLNLETEHDDQSTICEKLQKLFPTFVAVLYYEYSIFDTNQKPWFESNEKLLETGTYAIK